jgi:hypothetical protein
VTVNVLFAGVTNLNPNVRMAGFGVTLAIVMKKAPAVGMVFILLRINLFGGLRRD